MDRRLPCDLTFRLESGHPHSLPHLHLVLDDLQLSKELYHDVDDRRLLFPDVFRPWMSLWTLLTMIDSVFLLWSRMTISCEKRN